MPSLYLEHPEMPAIRNNEMMQDFNPNSSNAKIKDTFSIDLSNNPLDLPESLDDIDLLIRSQEDRLIMIREGNKNSDSSSNDNLEYNLNIDEENLKIN